MATPKGKLVTPVGFDPSGCPLALEVDANGYLKVVLTGAAGSDLLTELLQKLEPGDLNIEAGSKDLQVDVKSSALPSGAATQTTLANLYTELGQKLEPGDLNIDGITGNLQVDVVAAPTITVTQTTPANLLAGTHGYVNSAWRKNPIAFGYSDTLAQIASNTSLAAGTNTISAPACPAGYIWVITNLAIIYVGTVPTSVGVYVNSAGTQFVLYKQLAPATSACYDRNGYWVLEAGNYIQAVVVGATLNDDLYLHVYGFAVAIAL